MTTQLRDVATSQERQRLARDLHDAVSQTLFAVSLIAEVLPRIYEKNAAKGQARLEELRQLTRGALAEMRTLLLELRPAALADMSLPELLRQFSDAIIGRARIPVQMELGECSDLPPEVKVAFYRISQEALNNVAKHSGATHAWVALSCTDRAIHLVVRDDGAGFDPNAIPAGHLGLAIMRERAEAIGASLSVTSRPGEGSAVSLAWEPPVA